MKHGILYNIVSPHYSSLFAKKFLARPADSYSHLASASESDLVSYFSDMAESLYYTESKVFLPVFDPQITSANERPSNLGVPFHLSNIFCLVN